MQLSRDFYSRPCETVSRELLGKTLVRIIDNGVRISGKIVEIEAYLGVVDAACHAYQGKITRWNESMYKIPGTVYVYQRFKKIHCFNISTDQEGNPSALLIRALEPIEGIEYLKANRMKDRTNDIRTHLICAGPGKLCKAMNIDLSMDGVDIINNERIFVEEGTHVDDEDIVCDPRVRIGWLL
eukprot:TRINITY_DN2632_c0_g1_i4.p1 TRINITY_DN2632_c0_g1~~TRINITY_DN2632_c0_g1_i4.p1  ORF type:complete len:183 (+),score=36.22 TRINITY_DN2632_c0_g1_i4:1-549(+)